MTYHESFQIDDWIGIHFVIIMNLLRQLGNVMPWEWEESKSLSYWSKEEIVVINVEK